MSKIVVFLQNAWSPFYAGSEWPRCTWLPALADSPTGRRISLMVDDLDVCENTTPITGCLPNSVVKPDFEHIKAILERRKPETVVTCGSQATKALQRVWTGSLLILPHPAKRGVRNALFEHARKLLEEGIDGIVDLRSLQLTD